MKAHTIAESLFMAEANVSHVIAEEAAVNLEIVSLSSGTI